MATQEQFEVAFNQMATETTRIADYIASLVAQQQRTDLTEEQEAQVLSQLNAALDRLRQMGQSVENPTP